jgi:hypothetical protein
MSVSTPKCYDKTPNNDAYMNSDRNNYLKWGEHVCIR